MNEPRKWFYEIKVSEAVKNLTKHGFETIKVPDRSVACTEILKRVPSNKTVGLGGSVTLWKNKETSCMIIGNKELHRRNR